MIKGVIFDMDGVLVDNRDAHIEAFEIICRKYGVPFDREKFMPSFGMTNDLILERLMPEVYLLAARKLGLAPAECIVAEDAPVGIEAARRAGMSVIGVATTFRREDLSDYDLLIDDFTQIGPQQIRALKA